MIITIVKGIGGIAASVGTNYVVGRTIGALVPAATNTAQKVLMAVGTGVLGGMIGHAASKYVTVQIDEILESTNLINQENQETEFETYEKEINKEEA